MQDTSIGASERGEDTGPPLSAGFEDPVLAAVLSNRFEAIVREMTNTVLRTARSAVISSGRDFSCSIVSGANELVAVADGLPVHTFSSHFQTSSIAMLHPDVADGDAFLHNDPYLGNTHAADQTVMVPVFIDGEHLFTTCAKAHQADIGNSLPTTYHPFARDVYEEGALIFPCIRIQQSGRTNEDIVRLCMRRIRVPEQWRGDFLATLGAARIAERRLKDLCAQYGVDTIKTFVREWLDYSERLMAARIAGLPKATIESEGRHDRVGDILPDGIPLKARIDIDPEARRITVDLRESPDCVKAGFNQSEATATNNALTGVYNCLGVGIPRNSGAFRRVTVLLRENSVAGIPRFPASCSIATTNVGDRIVNLVHSAFAKIGNGFGLAEGGLSMGVNSSVISGSDFRHEGRPYINQLCLGTNGGPGSPDADGWATYAIPVASGLTFRDSAEISEIKFPMLIDHLHLIPGSGGAGKHRGGLAIDLQFRVREGEMTVVTVSDGHNFAPHGAHGGANGSLGMTRVIEPSGKERPVANFGVAVIKAGEAIRGWTNGGGGYGPPEERAPAKVLEDVLECRETCERAAEVYRVALVGSAEDGTLAIDEELTASMRGWARQKPPVRAAQGRAIPKQA